MRCNTLNSFHTHQRTSTHTQNKRLFRWLNNTIFSFSIEISQNKNSTPSESSMTPFLHLSCIPRCWLILCKFLIKLLHTYICIYLRLLVQSRYCPRCRVKPFSIICKCNQWIKFAKHCYGRWIILLKLNEGLEGGGKYEKMKRSWRSECRRKSKALKGNLCLSKPYL